MLTSLAGRVVVGIAVAHGASLLRDGRTRQRSSEERSSSAPIPLALLGYFPPDAALSGGRPSLAAARAAVAVAGIGVVHAARLLL